MKKLIVFSFAQTRKACMICLLVTLTSNAAYSHGADEWYIDKKDAARSQENVRMAGAICLAMIRLLVYPSSNYDELLNKYQNNCNPMSPKGEFLIKDQWLIKSDQARTVEDNGFSEVDVEVIGPKEFLTNSTPGMYENVIFRTITFYDANLKLRTITYWRRSRYNRRSFSELREKTHPDNILFDPEESWRDFNDLIQNELRRLSCYMIEWHGAQPPEICKGI